MKNNHPTLIMILLFGCIACILVFYKFQDPAAAQPPQLSRLEHRVENTIRERGTVESARSVEVRCEVGGGSTILSIAPEGSLVEKGDLLIELDDSALSDSLAAAEIQLEQSKAELMRGKVELEAAKRDTVAMLRVAEKGLHAAELSRQRVLGDGGELAYQLATTNSELTVAKERLKVAESLISGVPGDRGGKSIGDLRLIILEAREAIKVAEARKQFLEKYDRAYRAAILDLAVAERQMQVIRLKSEQEKTVRMAEAGMLAKEAAFVQDRQKLDRLRQQIERCRILAPQAGMVVYASTGSSRTGRVAIEEGAQVRERQPLIQIPDLNKLHVKVRVNESRISRVRVGQSAKIHIDAFPDKTLQGKVTQVSEFPEPASWLKADVKEYAVHVSINGPTESLKIGLTALVEIDAGGTKD